MTPQQPPADELLPCPFCGRIDIRFTEHKNAGRGDHRGEDVWSMCCYPCGARVPNMYKEHGRKIMVKAWNTRTHPPAVSKPSDEGKWKPLSEWMKTNHKYFWINLDAQHEPEIIWICDEPNTFFCKAGHFDNLKNIMHKLAFPISVPRISS